MNGLLFCRNEENNEFIIENLNGPVNKVSFYIKGERNGILFKWNVNNTESRTRRMRSSWTK